MVNNQKRIKMKTTLKHYFVISPEMEWVDAILEDGTGPIEYFHCFASIEADSPETAKILSLKSPDMKTWVEQQRSDGCNPFTGLKVEEAKCKHGVCFCDYCNSYGDTTCVKCIEELEN